ncbi:MAG: response regulator [Spirochaetales bacterium]|nr:response regulator [Spirochaetales bacterium]
MKTKKILIVDDEVHIRILLEQTLEDFEGYGIEILMADNGKKALELIQKEKPDLVFLDVMMPEINGYEVCNTVKNKLKLDNVYIAMLTAKGQEFDKKRGLEAGTDEYFTKPFDPDMIVRRSAAILEIPELM